MSTDAITAYMAECGCTRRLEFQISIQCAPVLKGMKSSNLVTAAKGSLKTVQTALAGTEILTVLLASKTRTETLFLYRPAMVKELLADEELRRFLWDRGYRRFDVASVLMGIRRGYTAYQTGEGEFPHELGALLDYPIKDVREFIRQKGENFLFAGYWKVYHHPLQAKYSFSQYDGARETAMQQIMDGYRLKEVAITKGESG